MASTHVWSPEFWRELFSLDALKRFTPPPGTDNFQPIIELVYVEQDDPTHKVHVDGMLIAAGELFNNQAFRHNVMAMMGAEAARQRYVMLGTSLAAEAWMATASAEEASSGQYRPVREHADKIEIMTVAGRTFDGRMSQAWAQMHRDSDQVITHLDPWKVQHQEPGGKRMQSHLLNSFWAEYMRAAKALFN